MLLVAGLTMGIGGPWLGSLKLWTALGCAGSGVALVGIAAGGLIGPDFPLRILVFALGLFNGIFAVAAIGSMMGLAGAGGEAERGTRMGVWGAAQGVAFGAGGFLGTVAVDLARLVAPEPVHAYAAVFTGEALLFVLATGIALHIEHAAATKVPRAQRRRAAPLHFEPRFER
jgi:BCD family chlorophyll transporter-like MFS transporter